MPQYHQPLAFAYGSLDAQAPATTQTPALDPRTNPGSDRYRAGVFPWHPMSVVQRLMEDVEQRMMNGLNDTQSNDRFRVLFEQAMWSPDLEVFTRGDRVVVRAALPSLKPETTHVHLEDGVLSITGERLHSDSDGPGEYGVDGYVRQLSLPTSVREEDTRTTLVGNILEISFPAN